MPLRISRTTLRRSGLLLFILFGLKGLAWLAVGAAAISIAAT